MITVISAAVVLGILIFVHELGHFLVAKRAGVGVTVFSLGFGPRLFGVKRGETDYRISAFPLGGFVRMIGEHPTDEVEPEDQDKSFALKPLKWRFAIVAAGPVSNILFALIAYYLVLMIWGMPTLTTLVGDVMPDQPAAAAGIKKGDVVREIDGKAMVHWGDMVEAIQGSEGRPVRLNVERDKRLVQLTMQPKKVTTQDIFGEDIDVYRVGIIASQQVVTHRVGLGEAVSLAFKKTYMAGEIIALSVYKLITQKVPLDSVGGPILIAQAAGEAAKHGIAPLMNLAGLISVNLAILNLLPIPALDGGHLFFFLVEGIRRRPVSLVVRERASQVGMALLLLLMVVIFYNDIARIVAGGTQ